MFLSQLAAKHPVVSVAAENSLGEKNGKERQQIHCCHKCSCMSTFYLQRPCVSQSPPQHHELCVGGQGRFTAGWTYIRELLRSEPCSAQSPRPHRLTWPTLGVLRRHVDFANPSCQTKETDEGNQAWGWEPPSIATWHHHPVVAHSLLDFRGCPHHPMLMTLCR